LSVLALLSGLYAESLDEATLHFRAEVQAAQSDDLSPAVREALRHLAGIPGEGSASYAERVRMVLDSMGEALPEKVRKSAHALVELGNKEAEEKSKALKVAAAEAMDELVKANDVPAIESLIQKTSKGLEEGSWLMANPRTRVALESLQRVNQFARQWLSVLQAKEEGNSKQALNALAVLRSQLDTSPTDASKLRERIRLMVRSLGVPSAEDAEKEIRGLLESVLAAKSAVEIDPILQKLRERQELWSASRDLSDGSIGSLAERASRFARTWQDYLAAKSSDNSERVRRALDTLAGEDLFLPGIPRSMLLQRAMSEAPAKAQGSTLGAGARPSGSGFDQLLLSCKTLEDLDKLLPQLEDAVRQGNPALHVPGPTNPFQILTELRAIDGNTRTRTRRNFRRLRLRNSLRRSGLDLVRLEWSRHLPETCDNS
jgi:hypothetical protein